MNSVSTPNEKADYKKQIRELNKEIERLKRTVISQKGDIAYQDELIKQMEGNLGLGSILTMSELNKLLDDDNHDESQNHISALDEIRSMIKGVEHRVVTLEKKVSAISKTHPKRKKPKRALLHTASTELY
jgi:predicted  nucleic acid-binding Zn-ribbon protein